MNYKLFTYLVTLVFLLLSSSFVAAQQRPNVILILTDDQGIGDLGCHGNPWIQTPNIDAFYKKAVRMTDFHVSPLCTPTRAAIMTGRYPIANGAWATYKGRDALSGGQQTMAAVFQENGYSTAMFGKWHLGDNYPVRPTDVGFEYVVQHKAGGVGELSDYWGNSYFDDTYFVNNEPQAFKGYCTDVWFEEAMKFIDKQENTPFFIYLPTNAPHSPLIVAEKYAAPYHAEEGVSINSAAFYGMISNIDENFGKLVDFLKKKKLTDNTILIFMTDNGTGNGVSKDLKIGYNYGFRGRKGFKTEGGHRVPFFIHWKDGEIKGGRDIDVLAAHIDLLPTLASLCKLELSDDLALDGLDFSGLLRKKRIKKTKLSKRTIFIHHRQDWRPPFDIDQTCLLQEDWRLVDGKALYKTSEDRMQQKDLAKQYPEKVDALLSANETFLQGVKQLAAYKELPCTVVGSSEQPEVTLTVQHAIGESAGIWKAEQVAAGKRSKNNTHAIEVARAGRYQISCRRWPKECAAPITGVPAVNPKNQYVYQAIHPDKVRITIANQIIEKTVRAEDDAIVFELSLQPGKTLLTCDFMEEEQQYGVYYTYIHYLGTP